MHQRIFNTQAVCLVDVNGDGMLDMVFNNEGQESAVLLGNPAFASKKTPVILRVAGNGGVTGSKVRVRDQTGQLLGAQEISTSSGRGGQGPGHARFALAPGSYRIEVRFSSGVVRAKEIKVATAPIREQIDEQTPKIE